MRRLVPALAALLAEGGDLTVKNSYLHDNQDGILTSANPSAHITLEDDELSQNGSGQWGYTHNVYIGHVGHFTMIGCWSHALTTGGPDSGHLVKSRAAVNEILYNRLYVGGNTFVNDAGAGTMILLGSGAQGTIEDDLFVGGGTMESGQATVADNLETDVPMFVDQLGYDYHLLPGSPAIDAGADPGQSFDGYALVPAREYAHPSATVPRPVDALLDVGAYEYVAASGADGGVADAGTADTGGTDAGAADAGMDGGRIPVDNVVPGGCGCSAAAGGGSVAGLLVLGLALAALGRRRRVA